MPSTASGAAMLHPWPQILIRSNFFTADHGFSTFDDISSLQGQTLGDYSPGGRDFPIVFTVGPSSYEGPNSATLSRVPDDAFQDAILQVAAEGPGNASPLYGFGRRSHISELRGQRAEQEERFSERLAALESSFEEEKEKGQASNTLVRQLQSEYEALSKEHVRSEKARRQAQKNSNRTATESEHAERRYADEYDTLMRECRSQKARLDKFVEQNAALKMEVESLRQANADLEQRVRQLEIENEQFLSMVNQDKEAMNRIKARHLLTVVQEHLAIMTGVTDSKIHAAAKWRDSLGPSVSLSNRLEIAKKKLAPAANQDLDLRKFVNSAGFELVASATTDIQTRGDAAAHPNPVDEKQYTNVVAGHNGLQSLLVYAVALSQSKGKLK